MKLLILFLLTGSLSASAIELADFRYDVNVAPEDRITEFDRACAAYLDTKPSMSIERVHAWAQSYAQRWRTADSGVEFARATIDEAVTIDHHMMAAVQVEAVPDDLLDAFDRDHQIVAWIQLYEGYTATAAELRDLQDGLLVEINDFDGAGDPPDDLRERWLHDIMLLTQQSLLAAQRKVVFHLDLELLAIAEQLRTVETAHTSH